MSDYEIPYSGGERRIGQRRKVPDRRAELRFEPHKEPRRKNNGRRTGEIREFMDKGVWGGLER
jgi:hypothetical protein